MPSIYILPLNKLTLQEDLNELYETSAVFWRMREASFHQTPWSQNGVTQFMGFRKQLLLILYLLRPDLFISMIFSSAVGYGFSLWAKIQSRSTWFTWGLNLFDFTLILFLITIKTSAERIKWELVPPKES
jgi:hypothetical protein